MTNTPINSIFYELEAATSKLAAAEVDFASALKYAYTKTTEHIGRVESWGEAVTKLLCLRINQSKLLAKLEHALRYDALQVRALDTKGIKTTGEVPYSEQPHIKRIV